MTRTPPRLTSALLAAALAVPQTTEAPSDLHGSIAAAVRGTPQRRPTAGSAIAATFGALRRPARLAITTLLLLLVLAAIAAVGAQLLRQPGPLGDSVTFRGDVARTGVVSGSGPGGAMAIAFRTTFPAQIVTSPAIVGDVAYVGAIDGRMRAVDLGDGTEIWSVDANVAWSSPSVAGDLVLVGTEDRDLVAIARQTGEVAWRLPLEAFTAGSPAIVGDRVYVATSSAGSRGDTVPGTGTVLAVDLATGHVAWREDLPGPSTRSIAVSGSILVVPTDVGIAVAFDTATGRELWRFSTLVFADTPVIADDKVFLAGLDPEGTSGLLWTVDLRTGQEIWRHRRPSGQTIVAPVVDERAGILYAGTVDGDVVALRIDDGAEAWTQRLGAEISSSPTKAGDVLYVAATGRVLALNATTGEVLTSIPIDGIPFAPAVSGGYLVLGTQTGNLYALVDAGAGVATTTPNLGSPSHGTPAPSPTLSQSPLPLGEIWARTPAELGLAGRIYLNTAPDGRLWVAESSRGRFVVLDAGGAVVDTWQPTGSAALDLVQADDDGWGAVAFAPGGDIFVADSDHQRVLRFDADRSPIGSWGSFGSGPGQFVSPFGITVGADGLVYVVDDSTCRVEVFQPSGTYVRTLAGGADVTDRCTNNVVVGDDGSVFLASGGRGAPWRITVFTSDGRVLDQFGEGLLREPVLLAPGRNGAIFATDGLDRLHRFDAGGVLRASWSGLDLEYLAIGPDDEVYATGPAGVIRRYSLAPG